MGSGLISLLVENGECLKSVQNNLMILNMLADLLTKVACLARLISLSFAAFS